jgi:tRNA pseudouridine32 synthase/23S rRNA pseudouridine746 synthase
MQILYQDKHLIVINKPSGLLSQPGSINDSVHSRLQAQFDFVGLIHRLDQATSGVMVLALTPFALSNIAKQFQDRETFKVYEARVFGHIPADKGHVDLPLRCDWPNRPRQEVHVEGRQSLTHWRLLGIEENCSRVELIPHTGRSHQLRVHMSAMGFPMIGDYFYAHAQALNLSERLHLHAKTLRIKHPMTQQPLTFHCKAPF